MIRTCLPSREDTKHWEDTNVDKKRKASHNCQVEDSGYFGAELRGGDARGEGSDDGGRDFATRVICVARGWMNPQAHAAKAPPLLESVELTPGGRRKHVLTRRSPGGTQRTAQYISHPAGPRSWSEGRVYNAQIVLLMESGATTMT